MATLWHNSCEALCFLCIFSSVSGTPDERWPPFYVIFFSKVKPFSSYLHVNKSLNKHHPSSKTTSAHTYTQTCIHTHTRSHTHAHAYKHTHIHTWMPAASHKPTQTNPHGQYNRNALTSNPSDNQHLFRTTVCHRSLCNTSVCEW